ncbi:MAG TPA: 3-isopropylmalate dehydratase large subunit [Rhizomicrobium sp.]|jgi:3-isopropylmalate/(R)-2-methylmalate dehydratase large subunit
MSTISRTLIDKVWDAHAITTHDDGMTLLWIDRHLVHEGSFLAFDQVAARAGSVAHPELTFGIADHYVPTRQPRLGSGEFAQMLRQLEGNTARAGIRLIGLDDPRQGIVHVVAPEQGLTLPGLTIVCGDSHTSTHGAFGAYAFGVGASEAAHVLMTQTLWQKRPKRMRMMIDGALGAILSAKDLGLNIIARIGAGGAQGHAIEYAGAAVRALSMEGRMTLCNLAIESGARLGAIAPDETTFAFLRGCAFAPEGDAFDHAVEDWRALRSDDDAQFDVELSFDASRVAPTVTWGVSPEQAVPIDAATPDPADIADQTSAEAVRDALAYMGLEPRTPMTTIRINRVFIGSCTNARIEDLRAAAAVLEGRKSVVPGLVSPGSQTVKRQAEEEGLARIFETAGLEWVNSGCSMCVAMNGDFVPAGERCASTTNRNFKGRQGPGSRTHLMSPAMAAAAAVTGRLTDARDLVAGRL